MKNSFTSLFAIAAVLSSANAHVKMSSPVPFRSNTQAPQGAASQDFDMTAPLAPSGANFPCKGYHKDAKGTQPLVDWAAGSTQTMTFSGSATHGGGSCQASFSEDGGASFKVVKSYIGGCPLKDASFQVPKETKSGPAIFAWTWFNSVGNREMYMNCAAVTITGGGSGLTGFPDIFKANIGNGCTTSPGDVAFPNPGKSVEGSGGLPPVGNCGGGGGTGGGNTGGGSGNTPVTTSQKAGTPTSPTSSTPVPPSYPTKVPGGGNPGGSNPGGPEPTTKPTFKPTSTAAPTPTSTPTYPNPPPPPNPNPNPSPDNGPACVEGAVTCNSDGTWSECGSGINQNMGKVAEGMTCKEGKIVRAKRSVRFSAEHMRRGLVSL